MREDPWKGIPIPSAGDVSALRVDPRSQFAFFWARKADGREALILTLSADPKIDKPLPQLRGVEVNWLEGSRQLHLVLIDLTAQEIFLVLCQDLVRHASTAADEVGCMAILISRLTRWQRLLSRGSPRILSEKEIRGLFAELMVLREELLPRFGSAAVSCWKGPEGAPQDYSVGGSAIEVKAHLVGAQPQVEISSINQLWTTEGSLYLVVHHLSDTPGSGESLPDLVSNILKAIDGDSTAVTLFEDRLAMVGYVALDDYQAFRYVSVQADSFLIGENFPRISPDNVPAGVDGVRYMLKLSACAPFKSPIQWPALQGKA